MSPSSRKLIVAALVIASDGRVLLTRRPEGKPLAGWWELPGGKVEAGEPPAEALRRELEEELGCASEIGAIEDVLHHVYEDNGLEVVILVYRCALLGEPRAIEVAEVRWVPVAELATLRVLPADQPLVDRLRTAGPR